MGRRRGVRSRIVDPYQVYAPFGITGFLAMGTGVASHGEALAYVPTVILALSLTRCLAWTTLVLQRRRGVGLRRTLVVGGGEPAATVVRRLSEFPEAGLAPVT